MNEAPIVSQSHSCMRSRTMWYDLKQNVKSIKKPRLITYTTFCSISF